MKNLYFGVIRFINNEEGVTAIEYALIASLIAVVIIGAVSATGTKITDVFGCVAKKLGVGSGTCPS